jgi:hypothetical protein
LSLKRKINKNLILANYLKEYNFFLDSSLNYENDFESLNQIINFLEKKLEIKVKINPDYFSDQCVVNGKTYFNTEIIYKDKKIHGIGEGKANSLFFGLINFINKTRDFNNRFTWFYLDINDNEIKKISFLDLTEAYLSFKWLTSNMVLLGLYDRLIKDFLKIRKLDNKKDLKSLIYNINLL